jgi:hypothetical protein
LTIRIIILYNTLARACLNEPFAGPVIGDPDGQKTFARPTAAPTNHDELSTEKGAAGPLRRSRRLVMMAAQANDLNGTTALVVFG